MKIIRTGHLSPRDKFPFFTENRDLWAKLKTFEVIEIPDELFEHLEGVAEVKERRGRKPKSTIENINEFTSLGEDKSSGGCTNCD